MTITIETNILKKFGLKFSDLGLLAFCANNPLSRKFITDNKELKKLWLYGFLDLHRKTFKLNEKRFLRLIIAMKESATSLKERATLLAPKLIELFPEGRKQGTNLYWRGNRMEITNKLKKFLSAYGDDFTDEQIINATHKYVQSFNGMYGYMRVLKYFIWKNVIKVGESSNYVEEVSDLLTWLESEGQEDELRQDWTNTLI